jgi:hypothetical protein
VRHEIVVDALVRPRPPDLTGPVISARRQYERASHARKQVTFSRGLRRRYRLAQEESDDEIADRDMGGDDMVALPAETWQAIRDRAEQLLTTAEVDGLTGAVLWLTEGGLAWSRAIPSPRPVWSSGPGVVASGPQDPPHQPGDSTSVLVVATMRALTAGRPGMDGPGWSCRAAIPPAS